MLGEYAAATTFPNDEELGTSITSKSEPENRAGMEVSMWRWGRVALVVTTLLACAMLTLPKKDPSTSFVTTHVASNAQIELVGVSHAGSPRSFTRNYIQLRFANDVVGLKKLMTPSTTLDVDTSSAGWILSGKMKMALGGTHFVGPEAIAKYYIEFPVEDKDVQPAPSAYACSDDACSVTTSVHRFPVGQVKTAASLMWTNTGMLKSVKMVFSTSQR